MVTVRGCLGFLRANCRGWSPFGALLVLACGAGAILTRLQPQVVDSELLFVLDM